MITQSRADLPATRLQRVTCDAAPRRRFSDAPVSADSATADEWRAEFVSSDELRRLQLRARLARLANVERDPVVRAELSDLLAEMRMCR